MRRKIVAIEAIEAPVEAIVAIEAIEAPVEAIEAIEASEPPPLQKVKKPRSQAQIDAFARAVAKRSENRAGRAAEKAVEADAERARLEAKVVKKAIAVKKKQMKADLLDALSEDEEVDQDIQRLKQAVVKKRTPRTLPPLPPAPAKIVFR